MGYYKWVGQIIITGLCLMLFSCSIPPAGEINQGGLEAQSTGQAKAEDAEPTNTPLPNATSVSAGDRCSPQWQQNFIDEAYSEYQEARSTENDALSALTDWLGGVSADLAVACNQSIVETTDPDQLAELLEKLNEGGYVIYVRHTHTDRTREDTDVSLGRCEFQRVLSDRGRDEALFIRNGYQQLGLPVSRLISTQYCRTLETAILAFGVPLVVSRSDLTNSLTALLATVPEPGTNTMIVAHIGTIRNAIGLDATFEEGDSLVYQPDGEGGFDFVGRIGLYDWPTLARIQSEK